jgi:hypothetical protein
MTTMRAIHLAQAFGVSCLALGAAACSDDPRIPDGNHYTGVVVIDDMEDGQQNILSDSGRVGIWYIYSDETDGSTQEPAIGFPMWPNGAGQPPRPCGTFAAPLTPLPYFNEETSCKYVARTYGTGQVGFGAGVGVDLKGEGGVKNPISAVGYRGIGFFARGSVRAQTLRVNVQDVQTTPESAAAADRRGIARCGVPASCDTPAAAADPLCQAPPACNDHFGASITLPMNGGWQWFELPFATMSQAFPGFPSPPATLRIDAIVGIQFQVVGADADANPANGIMDGSGQPGTIQPFDFSIDNLSFLL